MITFRRRLETLEKVEQLLETNSDSTNNLHFHVNVQFVTRQVQPLRALAHTDTSPL